jgi:hypothetical protein
VKKMPKHLRGAAVLAPLVLAACGSSGLGGGSAPDTLAYAMKDASRGTGECRSADSARTPVPCVQVNLIWPDISDTSRGAQAAKGFVERVVRSSFSNGNDATSTDSVVNEVVALHALMTKSHKDGYKVGWLAERKVTVACNERGRFGVKVFSNQFMGGSHPTSATRYATFDTRTGERLELDDLIAKGKERALKEAAIAAYAKRKDVASVGEVKIGPDEFPEPKSALACGDSLLLQYDVVALGPHRMIGSEIVVPKTALKGVLR